ncbi:MAG: choice-of-anchor D domain-containing protein [Bacteroidetes bacterium]|nr:choice-of-anchor D domain-containing protein [Bacteroidota bacterium]
MYRTWIGVLLSIAFAEGAAGQPVVIWREDFSSAQRPNLPAGWSASGSGWRTDDQAPSPGSGGLNLMHNAQAAGQVLTPPVDLRGATEAELRYWVRTSQLSKTLTIRALAGGGSPAVLIAAGDSTVPAAVNTYQERVFRIPATLLGQSQVRFQFETSGSGTLRLDDLQVRAVAPLFRVSPELLDFGFVPLGARAERTLEVRNAGSRPLRLGPPEVTGEGFSVSPADSASLDPGQVRQYAVRFAPVQAGSASGQIRWSHNAGGSPASVPLQGGGLDTANALGFVLERASVWEDTADYRVELALAYADTSARLGGVQFELRYDPARLAWMGLEPGPGWAAGWRLEAEDSTGRVRVLALDPTGSGLGTGAYRPWMRLRWRVLPLSQGLSSAQTTLEIGGLRSAQARPDGRPATLRLGRDRMLLEVRARLAYAVSSVDSLALGAVAVGQTKQAAFQVRNPGGSRPLRVLAVSSTNALFTVEPSQATVAPGAEASFTVRFQPTKSQFGPQRGRVRLTHDGLGGVLEIPVSATGLHGRGDGQGDGLVNVLDLVRGIEGVLGRRALQELERRALDLFPFPDGDGLIDVRDLVVLVQAILRGRWPDDLPLPAGQVAASEPSAGIASLAPLRLWLHTSNEGLRLECESEQPFMGLELRLRLAGAAGLEAVRLDSSLGPQSWVGYRAETQEYVLLWAAMDGRARPSGRYPWAFIARPNLRTHYVSVRAALAAGSEGEPLSLSWTVLRGTAQEAESSPVRTWALGTPYPNPLVGPELLIPIEAPQARIVRVWIFDAMGRRVRLLFEGMIASGRHLLRWDGRNTLGTPVPPGLYGVRLEAGPVRLERAFLVGRLR